MSMKKAEKVLRTVNPMYTRRTKGIMNRKHCMGQCIVTRFFSSLTENMIWRYILGENSAVAFECWLIHSSIVGKMNHLVRYSNFNRVRENSARTLKGSALPKSEVLIRQNGNQ
jgi:hypothetical protein